MADEADTAFEDLASDEPTLTARVDAFRASIAPDLYSPDVYLPWPEIELRISELGYAIQVLQDLVSGGQLRKDVLAEALVRTPRVHEVILLLFAAPSGAGFADGRELPALAPATPIEVDEFSDFALDLGVDRILTPRSQVADLVRTALVGLDSRRRSYRRRGSIEARISSVIQDALDEVRTSTGVDAALLPLHEQPEAIRNRARAVVAADGVPIAGVATFLQAQGGGRQRRDLSVTYPRLQEALDSIPMLLSSSLTGVESPKPRARCSPSSSSPSVRFSRLTRRQPGDRRTRLLPRWRTVVFAKRNEPQLLG